MGPPRAHPAIPQFQRRPTWLQVIMYNSQMPHAEPGLAAPPHADVPAPPCGTRAPGPPDACAPSSHLCRSPQAATQHPSQESMWGMMRTGCLLGCPQVFRSEHVGLPQLDAPDSCPVSSNSSTRLQMHLQQPFPTTAGTQGRVGTRADLSATLALTRGPDSTKRTTSAQPAAPCMSPAATIWLPYYSQGDRGRE